MYICSDVQVVAAACIVTSDVDILGITDSKKIKEEDRERLFGLLSAHPAVRYGMCAPLLTRAPSHLIEPELDKGYVACRGIVDAAGIDDMNILQATLRAMEQAVQQIKGDPPAAVLVDGNRVPPGIQAQHVDSVIKGDAVCYSIAAASILAKVTRDRMMMEAHGKWPQYGFATHKGAPLRMLSLHVEVLPWSWLARTHASALLKSCVHTFAQRCKGPRHPLGISIHDCSLCLCSQVALIWLIRSVARVQVTARRHTWRRYRNTARVPFIGSRSGLCQRSLPACKVEHARGSIRRKCAMRMRPGKWYAESSSHTCWVHA